MCDGSVSERAMSPQTQLFVRFHRVLRAGDPQTASPVHPRFPMWDPKSLLSRHAPSQM